VDGHRDGFAQLLRLKSLVSLSLGIVDIKSLSSHKEHNTSLQYMKRDLEREFVPCKLLECPTEISRSLQTLSLTILGKSELDEMECVATSLGNSNLTNLELCVRTLLSPLLEVSPPTLRWLPRPSKTLLR